MKLLVMTVLEIYGVITNDVSDYVNLLVRIAHIICNHPLYFPFIRSICCQRRTVITFAV